MIISRDLLFTVIRLKPGLLSCEAAGITTKEEKKRQEKINASLENDYKKKLLASKKYVKETYKGTQNTILVLST